MTFLALIAIIFFGFAVYNLTCAFVDIPTKKTSQMMMLSRKQQGTKNEKLLDVYVTKIAGWIAPYLRLDRLKRNKVQCALDIAGLQLTPEIYTARAWVTAGAVGLCAIPMAFLIPLLVPILIGLAVALWFSTYYAAFDFVKKRRKLIEGEIPRFALTVGQSLENDRDVLKILTSYRRVAGKDFGAELDQTIADMKTGNYENALIRFETRIGSPMLSDVIRGLIGVLRGDDQRMYFKMITFDMRQIEQNNLKKEAAKRPKKIQRYSMMMLICIMIIYLVVKRQISFLFEDPGFCIDVFCTIAEPVRYYNRDTESGAWYSSTPDWHENGSLIREDLIFEVIANGVVCALDGNGNFEGKKTFVPFYQFRQSLVQSVHTQHPHLQDHEALREKLLSLPDARETVGHGWYWENWLFATDVENTAEEAVDSAEWLNSQFHILAVRYTHKPTGFVFTNYRFRDKRAEAKSSGHDLLLYDWKDQ